MKRQAPSAAAIAGTPEKLTAFLAAEAQKYSKLIRDANIKGE